MNLWHDKSYISPSGPEWVERGYAMYDVHSVRFQFVYTEEQKKANRRAHTVSDVDQAVLMAAETRTFDYEAHYGCHCPKFCLLSV